MISMSSITQGVQVAVAQEGAGDQWPFSLATEDEGPRAVRGIVNGLAISLAIHSTAWIIWALS